MAQGDRLAPAQLRSAGAGLMGRDVHLYVPDELHAEMMAELDADVSMSALFQEAAREYLASLRRQRGCSHGHLTCRDCGANVA